jgi:integrase
VYGETKQEVQAKLDAIRADVRAGTHPDAGNLSVGQLLEQWLKSSQAKTSTRTHEERERVVRLHLKPRVGRLKLAKLTALHVEGLYADLHADKVGPFAVRTAADLLAIALNHAVRLQLMPSSPAARVPKPRLPKPEKCFLTDAQVKALVSAAAGAACRPLLVLALATGCRQGEILGLSWDDVDLDGGSLTVRKSLSKTRGGFVLKEPKNPTSRRTVKLPAAAVEALAPLKASAVTAGLLAAPVFCTRTGGHLDKKNVIRAFRAVVTRANKGADAPAVPPAVRFHDLRHTVASLLLSKGCSLRAVAARLGHADPAMTLRVYAHVMPNDDAQLAERLDAVLA